MPLIAAAFVGLAALLQDGPHRQVSDEEVRTLMEKNGRSREEDQRANERRKAAEEAFLMKAETHVLAWSGLACALRRLRRSSQDAIAEERKYAAEGGGIVDMRKLYGQQRMMRIADRGLALVASELKKLGRTQAKCSDPTVRNIAACHKRFGNENCNSVAAQPYLDMTREALEDVVKSASQ